MREDLKKASVAWMTIWYALLTSVPLIFLALDIVYPFFPSPCFSRPLWYPLLYLLYLLYVLDLVSTCLVGPESLLSRPSALPIPEAPKRGGDLNNFWSHERWKHWNHNMRIEGEWSPGFGRQPRLLLFCFCLLGPGLVLSTKESFPTRGLHMSPHAVSLVFL